MRFPIKNHPSGAFVPAVVVAAVLLLLLVLLFGMYTPSTDRFISIDKGGLTLDEASRITQNYLGDGYYVGAVQAGLPSGVVRVTVVNELTSWEGSVYVLPDRDGVIAGTLLTLPSALYPPPQDAPERTTSPNIEAPAVVDPITQAPSRPQNINTVASSHITNENISNEEWFIAPELFLGATVEHWLDEVALSDDKANSFYEVAAQQSSIITGSGPLDMYIYFDPYCPHCHALYAMLATEERVTAHWIPISIGTAFDPSIPNDFSLTAAAVLHGAMQVDFSTAQSLFIQSMAGIDILQTASAAAYTTEDAWNSAIDHTYYFASMIENVDAFSGTPVVIWENTDGSIGNFVATPSLQDLDAAISDGLL